MIPTRPVRLLRFEQRRDPGPVVHVSPGRDGADATLRYTAVRGRGMMLVLAALGAGLVGVAPLLALSAPALSLVAVVIGAAYVVAVRLVSLARSRDRTLALHGQFLPRFARMRPTRLRHPDRLAMRLQRALAAGHVVGDAGDAVISAALRAVLPMTIGAWLSKDGAIVLPIFAAAFLTGALLERRHACAGARAFAVRHRLTVRASDFVTSWPVLRNLGAGRELIERLRRGSAIPSIASVGRASVRASIAFEVGTPAVTMLAIAWVAPTSILAAAGLLVAAAAAWRAGLVIAWQGARLRRARTDRHAADRLFKPDFQETPRLDRIETLVADDLAYRYPDTLKPVFAGIRFALRRGEVLALSSPSGSGKTTLLRLLTGLAEPTSGRILVNDLDGTRAGYRHRVVAVFQDEPIGAGTIRAALTAGAAMSLEEVWAAAERVGVDAAIRALPMEMQTLIVEGPFPRSLLQPLLIARGVAQRPDLLILDESLSALALETTRSLLEGLRQDGTMVIFASHDPQIVALADQVLEIG